jgi:hypothetical protein
MRACARARARDASKNASQRDIHHFARVLSYAFLRVARTRAHARARHDRQAGINTNERAIGSSM